MASSIIRKAFKILRYEQATKILDQITKTNRGWHTWEEDRGACTYAI